VRDDETWTERLRASCHQRGCWHVRCNARTDGGHALKPMPNTGILAKLHQHHLSLTRLIRDINERIDLGENDYGALYVELRRELLSHSAAEDEVLFSALAAHEQCREDIRDGRDEHEEIEEILHELDRTEDEDEWLTTFQELEDAVQSHIDEVETGTFAVATQVLDTAELGRLARDYQRERGRVMAVGTGKEADDDEDDDETPEDLEADEVSTD